jgi:dihydroorotate dehydrogenase electron transfer subunit
MIQDFNASVLRNEYLGGGNFLMEFTAPEMSAVMTPGQFFMLGMPGSEILLRRPFSVCGLPGTFRDGAAGAVQVLYKVVGRGTRHMAGLKEDAALTILGPLGNGFSLPADRSARPVLVAGGIGAAPFPALIAELDRRNGPAPILYYGAATAEELPLLEWFQERCEQVVITTDDGSLGNHGLVTGPLESFLARGATGPKEIYACGPEPMLQAVRSLALSGQIPCQLSLEAHMACGFGVCIGCVVPTHGKDGRQAYERVCAEGPVMRAERLAW